MKMKIVSDAFYRVMQEGKRWGISFEWCDDDKPEHIEGETLAPSLSARLIWPEMRILWDEDARLASDEEAPLDLLHEISHCIVGVNPYKVNEPLSPMLWYEYVTAKNLGLSSVWDRWMEGYGVDTKEIRAVSGNEEDYSDTWHYLKPRQRKALLDNSKRIGIKHHLFKKDGVTPTYEKIAPSPVNIF